MVVKRLLLAGAVLLLAAAGAWGAFARGDTAAAAGPDLRGSFESLTQRTTGTARLVHRPDGRRVLKLAGFSTRAAPDLFVHLVPRPSPSGEIGGGMRLDSLYPISGDSTYEVPASFDASNRPTVVIWCAACHVAFGAAVLAPAGSRPA